MSARRQRLKPKRLSTENPTYEKELKQAIALSLQETDPTTKTQLQLISEFPKTNKITTTITKKRKSTSSSRSKSPKISRTTHEEKPPEFERTKYKGVVRSLATGQYRASVSRKVRGGAEICLGWFATALEAAIAADEAARRLHGDSAVTNFEAPPGLPLFYAPLRTGRSKATLRPPTWYETELEALFCDCVTKKIDDTNNQHENQ
uniref:AP2/ERF domain-containing protein n=1 Tax=Aureoumbra lagunensis TaxID=44058 RepID=A0A7S3JS60_9STRA